jgi:hypothetical protein
VQEPSSVPPKSLANLLPGGSPGNLNNFRHGRYSKQLRAHREYVRLLNQLAIGSSQPNVLEYTVALRWSRQDRAVLEIAVAKMAYFVHHHIVLANALAAGEHPPSPPDIHISRIEQFLYRRYVDQRRALSGASFPVEADPSTEAARLAREMLSDWLLASDVLGPEAATAYGLAEPAERMGIASAGSAGSANSASSAGSANSNTEITAPEEAA